MMKYKVGDYVKVKKFRGLEGSEIIEGTVEDYDDYYYYVRTKQGNVEKIKRYKPAEEDVDFWCDETITDYDIVYDKRTIDYAYEDFVINDESYSVEINLSDEEYFYDTYFDKKFYNGEAYYEAKKDTYDKFKEKARFCYNEEEPLKRRTLDEMCKEFGLNKELLEKARDKFVKDFIKKAEEAEGQFEEILPKPSDYE